MDSLRPAADYFLRSVCHRPRDPSPSPAPVRSSLPAPTKAIAPAKARRGVTLLAWTIQASWALAPCASFCPAAAAKLAACWRGSFRSAAITSPCSPVGRTPHPGRPCIGMEISSAPGLMRLKAPTSAFISPAAASTAATLHATAASFTIRASGRRSCFTGPSPRSPIRHTCG